jgi:hypothetical protein
VNSSRFVAEFAGMKKAETSVSRFIPGSIAVAGFLDRHPKLSRFIAHIPGASKFLPVPSIPRSLRAGGHVAPVYNARARKPDAPAPKM